MKIIPKVGEFTEVMESLMFKGEMGKVIEVTTSHIIVLYSRGRTGSFDIEKNTFSRMGVSWGVEGHAMSVDEQIELVESLAIESKKTRKLEIPFSEKPQVNIREFLKGL